MRVIHCVELKQGSYEELLPGFSPDFPYIASLVELDQYIGRQSPWHWHKEVEFFYMDQGALEYNTPQGKTVFPPGSGGFVNSGVLHMSRTCGDKGKVTAHVHLFSPSLISGQSGSLIDQRYVTPLITAAGAEILGLYPDNPEHTPLLSRLKSSFQISEQDYAYEIHLRAELSGLWCGLLKLAAGLGAGRGKRNNQTGDKIKAMMAFIHKHYGEKTTVAEIAAAAFISERECFRIFRDCLNMTPVEYMTGYRVQKACSMLAEGNEPVTGICQACGLGNSSYFGKVFREHTGCSPIQYRMKWQNSYKNWR